MLAKPPLAPNTDHVPYAEIWLPGVVKLDPGCNVEHSEQVLSYILVDITRSAKFFSRK